MADIDRIEPYRAFLADWLVHIGERAVRIRAFLKSASLETGDWKQVPPVLARLEHETLDHLAEVRATYAAVRADGSFSFGTAASTAGRIIGRHLRRHHSIHAKLAVVPRAWVRSEIEYFLRRATKQLSPEALRSIGVDRDLLDTFTVISTARYDFADIPWSAETEQKGGAEGFPTLENVLTIPMIEQGSILFWGTLVHEFCRAVIARSGVRTEAVSSAAFRQLPAATQALFSDDWIEEIACDLLSSDLIGPQYYVSFVNFCLNWVIDPVPTVRHPPPEARMDYIRRRLEETNAAFLGAFDGTLTLRRTLRAELDRARDAETPQDLAARRDPARFPTNDIIFAMADAISGSRAYRELLRAPYTVDPSHVHRLRTRFAGGEFIAASRREPRMNEPAGADIDVRDFEQHVADLVEIPNDVFDITTACILHLGDLELSETYGNANHLEKQRVPSLKDSIHEIFSSGAELSDTRLAQDLGLYLRRLDGTVGKSLEVREIAEFLQQSK